MTFFEELSQLQEEAAAIRQQQTELLLDYLYRVSEGLHKAEGTYDPYTFEERFLETMTGDVDAMLDVLENADPQKVTVHAFPAFESFGTAGTMVVMVTYEKATSKVELHLDMLEELGIE